jgi:hypothetical protein
MLAYTQELVIELASAFEDVQRPSDDRIFKPNAAYFFDIDQAIRDFTANHWKQLALEALVKHKDNLPFLTPQAFHYYLPAFLIASIEHPKTVDVLRDNVIHSLAPPIDNEDFASSVSIFTQQQAKAVLNFFVNYTEIYSPEEWSFTLETAETVRRGIQFWKSLL